MVLTTAMLLLGMMTANAAISTTSTNTSEQTVPTTTNPTLKKEPNPKSADSYETPTTGTGDMSAMGEASATDDKKRPRTRADRKKTAKKSLMKQPPYENCDAVVEKEACEKTIQMNRSMQERTDRQTAEQRGGGPQADTSLE